MPLRPRTVAILLTFAAGCSPAADGAGSTPVGAAPRSEGPAEPAAIQATASAIAVYTRRTALDPRDHLSPTLLAELHLRRAAETQDPAAFLAAEDAARTALARSDRHPQAVAALAQALAATGRAPEAERIVRELLTDQPRSVPLLCVAFDLAAGAGDPRGAADYAERLLALNEEPATLCRLAQVAAHDGDTDRAVTLLRRAAAEAEDLGGLPAELAEYRRRAGEILLRSSRHAEAAAEFDAAIAVNPRDADAWAGRAQVLARRGDRAGAAGAAETARAIRPIAAFATRLERALSPEEPR